MKLLILACLLGFSAAAFLKDAAPAGSLRAALDMPDAYELDQVEDDIKTELGKRLKEKLDMMMEKINDAINHGKNLKEEWLDKASKIGDELKDLGVEVGNRLKEKLNELKEKLKGIKENLWNKFKELWEKLTKGKRDVTSMLDYLRQLKFRELLEDIKQKILSNETIQKIREYIRNFVTTNPILQKMKEAMLKLKDVDLRQLIKHLLHLDEDGRGTRSLKELWEKIKDYFKDLGLQIKEKFMKFGEWVKVQFKDHLGKLKDKHEKVKEIAKELLDHFKDVSKDVWAEGIEFLRQYKEDLGALWDQLLEKGKEVIKE